MISLDADRVATARREAEHKVRGRVPHVVALCTRVCFFCFALGTMRRVCRECGLSRRAATSSKAGVHANPRARTDSAYGCFLPTP